MQPIVTDRVAWSVGLFVGLSQSWALQKRLNRSRCLLGWGFGWAKESSKCYMGCTLAPPGEYDWTERVRWRCGLFVKLLWPLVIIHSAV